MSVVLGSKADTDNEVTSSSRWGTHPSPPVVNYCTLMGTREIKRHEEAKNGKEFSPRAVRRFSSGGVMKFDVSTCFEVVIIEETG